MRVHPDLQVEQLSDLGENRYAGVEVIDLDVDLVDLTTGTSSNTSGPSGVSLGSNTE
jgi:hypothetical protein